VSDPGKEIMLADLEEECKAIARLIKRMMPPGVGFTLMMFTMGPGGWMTYLSSAERTTMLKAMKEFIEKAEADPSA
jgi:hypothetical protein